MSDVHPPAPPPGPAGSAPPPPPPPPATPPPNPIDLQAIRNDFVAVLTRPIEFWPTLRGRQGFGPPIVFAAAMGVLAGIIGALYSLIRVGSGGYGGYGVTAALVALILSIILYPLIGSFVGGAIVHVLALIAGGRSTYETSVRIASYAMAVMPIAALLSMVPLLGILPHLYGLYLIALGIIALHDTPRQRTLIVVGVLALIVIIIDASAWFAARSAARFMEQVGGLQRP